LLFPHPNIFFFTITNFHFNFLFLYFLIVVFFFPPPPPPPGGLSTSHLSERASLDPRKIYTIPNAIDPDRFKPDKRNIQPKGSINIVLMSRHVYRKGIDLVVGMIPLVCEQCPEAHFILGGILTAALSLAAYANHTVFCTTHNCNPFCM
jgi:glycosyltransferase involved in cell wall biosynthesis